MWGRSPLFSSISLSFPFFFIFRGLVADSFNGNLGRGGRGEGGRRPKESVHRERKCAFPLFRALFNPRSLVLDVPMFQSTLLSPIFHSRHAGNRSLDRTMCSHEARGFSFPPSLEKTRGEKRKEKHADERKVGRAEKAGERERRFLRSEMSRFSKIDKGVVRSVEGSRGTGHNRKRSLHFASHLSRRAAFNPPPSSH